MKQMILALAAILTLGVGAATAQSYGHRSAPSQSTQQNNWMGGGGG